MHGFTQAVALVVDKHEKKAKKIPITLLKKHINCNGIF
jgi:hypothetical protein